uniref:GP-PDE domain-containing protein n=1 Tax=Glossina brevipalpis TaxID=37001 RepID=A0A1A9W9B0_9MUSC
MQRWFYADAESKCVKRARTPSPERVCKKSSPISLEDIPWKFCVDYKKPLCSNETLAIIGNIEVLGKWKPKHCLVMKEVKNGRWCVSLMLPRKEDIYYRYLVIGIDGKHRKIIRFWETHYEARCIKYSMSLGEEDGCYDVFGNINGEYQVDRGWVMFHSVMVQFKFFKAPFVLCEHSKPPLLYVKVQPLRMTQKKTSSNEDPQNEQMLDGSNALNAPSEDDPNELKTTFAFTEVVALKNNSSHFTYQPKFGTPCGPNDMLIFHMTLGNFPNTAYEIDFYSYPRKAASDIPPYHFGYLYIMPHQLNKSNGTLALSIMCGSKNRPIGTVLIDYLVIRPLPHDINMEETLMRYWNPSWINMQIGHRGCGKSHWRERDILRENTIKSIQMAYENGADMVEIDVQLTKDKVPILYHDLCLKFIPSDDIDIQKYDAFHFTLTKDEIFQIEKYKKDSGSNDVRIPLNQFTLAQLKAVKIHVPRRTTSEPNCSLNTKGNRPFVTLETVLKKIPGEIILNIDVKWPIRLENGGWVDCVVRDGDMNDFLDAILEIVLKYAKSRKIIFSAFNPDVATMLNLKQNKYPVFFLCQGAFLKMKHIDPRAHNLDNVVSFAHAMGFQGINVHVNQLLEYKDDFSFIRKAGLHLFTWGTRNRDEEFRRNLNIWNLDGIVYDRIHQYHTSQDLAGNIAYIELKEDERPLTTKERIKCDSKFAKCLK